MNYIRSSGALLTFVLMFASAAHSTITFNYSGTTVDYTVQRSGLYNMTAAGAVGGGTISYSGSAGGGYGGVTGGAVMLNKGDTLAITVGGAGTNGYPRYVGGGGGGATYVTGSSAKPLLIAAGGGGSGNMGIYSYGRQAGRGGEGVTSGDGSGGKSGDYAGGGGGGGLHGAGGSSVGGGRFGGVGGSEGAGGPGGSGGIGNQPSAGFGGFGGGGGGGFAYYGGYGGGGGGGGFSGGNAGSGGSNDTGDGGVGGTSYIDTTVTKPFAAAGVNSGNGYAAIDSFSIAIPTFTGGSVGFGVYRQGSSPQTVDVPLTNTVTGLQSDSLIAQSNYHFPGGVTMTTPGPLAAGQRSTASFTLNMAVPGFFLDYSEVNFISHDDQLADVLTASYPMLFFGTVTQSAVSGLFKSSGAGAFSGAGNAYSLDLGPIRRDSGVVSTVLGVRNLIPLSLFSESLGGGFTRSSGSGFDFVGTSFSSLSGGQSDIGNWLRFDTTGLKSGRYNETFTFNGYSTFTGRGVSLGAVGVDPFSLNVTALVTAAVPEPAAWALIMIGLGGVGVRMRSCRRAVPPAADVDALAA